jgi:hypothetical protein
MSNVKQFLKTLSKVGYPNRKITTIAEMMDYDLENFLLDLNELLGEDKLHEFVQNAISKISTDNGLKVEDGDEFINFGIEPLYFDEDESETDYVVKGKILDSKILWQDQDGEGSYKTIDQINDDLDFLGYSDYQSMMDYFRNKAYNIIHQQCGFGVWWE